MKIEEINGLILVDKAEGMTSFGVDSALKKILGTKKTGHIGTLDPFATGLLPVCVGKGLRFVRFADGYDKAYRCTCVFGKFTDTMDLEGEVIGGREPTEEEMAELKENDYAPIREAFNKASKMTSQLPPKYSAKKINGKKAYELAREGKEVELKPVPVKIYGIDIISIEVVNGAIEVVFDVRCSKGTYIREICNSVGEMTGFGAYAKTLRRTANGPFDVANAFTLEQIRVLSEVDDTSFFIDASEIITDMPSLELNDKEIADIRLGRKLLTDRFKDQLTLEQGAFYKVTSGEQVVAVVYEALEKGRSILRIERMLG